MPLQSQRANAQLRQPSRRAAHKYEIELPHLRCIIDRRITNCRSNLEALQAHPKDDIEPIILISISLHETEFSLHCSHAPKRVACAAQHLHFETLRIDFKIRSTKKVRPTSEKVVKANNLNLLCRCLPSMERSSAELGRAFKGTEHIGIGNRKGKLARDIAQTELMSLPKRIIHNRFAQPLVGHRVGLKRNNSPAIAFVANFSTKVPIVGSYIKDDIDPLTSHNIDESWGDLTSKAGLPNNPANNSSKIKYNFAIFQCICVFVEIRFNITTRNPAGKQEDVVL